MLSFTYKEKDKMRGRKVSNSQKVLIAKLHIEGKTHQEISEETGLARITVIRYLNHDEEVKEMIQYLEQQFKNDVFNKSIEMIKEGYNK